MYTLNSKLKEWWGEVSLIVWGPSAKLLAEDAALQEYIGKIKDAGVELLACKACTDSYGVSDVLENMGINVKYMGQVLTCKCQLKIRPFPGLKLGHQKHKKMPVSNFSSLKYSA